jgi:hypothetical protein
VTTRKRNLVPRGDRPPAFVDRETGAAELRISPETWDRWNATRVGAGLPRRKPALAVGRRRQEIDWKGAGDAFRHDEGGC